MISSNARFRFDAPSNVSNIHCEPKTEYTKITIKITIIHPSYSTLSHDKKNS